MVTILVVGLIAWALTGAVEDTVRAARGQDPRTERRGLRGYLDDRFKALADHHHAVAASGLLTAGDARMARRHLARTKALKLAGLADAEDVARAKAEHRHRLRFIDRGIDPDTMPPLFPPRGQEWEPPEPDAVPVVEADPEPTVDLEPAAPTVDDHFDSNQWGTEFADAATATSPDPGAQKPWTPYAPNTDTKETTMPNNGEITGPAGVLEFHNDLKAVMDATRTIADSLTGTATDLQERADEMGDNIPATETAAAGMERLGMTDAVPAAMELMETQGAIQTEMNALAEEMNKRAAAILDLATASGSHLAAIKTAYDAQLLVRDARDGAGRGNLATDTYLDNND